jgi:hypothetical protein
VEGIGDDITGLGGSPKRVLINRTLDWMLGSPTAVGPEGEVFTPSAFQLHANYPNPFNPSTTLEFTIGDRPLVARVVIYNLLGQEIRELANSAFTPGRHSLVWDGRNSRGAQVATGVYFYRLESGEQSVTRKMLLLK